MPPAPSERPEGVADTLLGGIDVVKRIADHERIEVPIKNFGEFPKRILVKFDASGDCWEWYAAKTALGYGCVYWRGKQRMAYRVVWELLVGPIPDELDIDHLCRNPPCVNPDHLQPVPHGVNMNRGYIWEKSGKEKRARTHCPQGHPYNEQNTFYFGPKRYRACRTCRKAQTKAWKQKVNYISPERRRV